MSLPAAPANWARVNRNPKVTQELSGLADLATTMTFYSEVGTDAKRQTASDIDALLAAKTDAQGLILGAKGALA